MRKPYTQLTAEERYHIEILNLLGWSSRKIGDLLARHHTTIVRELSRNACARGYVAKPAHALALQRHQVKPKAVKLTREVLETIVQWLKKKWSPELICGRLNLRKGINLHHESIYRYLLKDKSNGGNLFQCLCLAGKKRRKRYGKQDFRGVIPGRVDISQRPDMVDARQRVGDWEADTVIGKDHKGAIVTLLERRSRLYLALPIARKSAELTCSAIQRLLRGLKSFVHTITFDNGREFSHHQRISQVLRCEGYFAKPYSSWQRGQNEQCNGLLRRWFPKHMHLHELTEQQVFDVVDQINHRPRKCLDYRTPWEVFIELTQNKPGFIASGALMS